jgi:hypothetical protein
MTKHRILLSALMGAAMATVAFAADVTGTWTASFDTKIGPQKYTYTFKVDGKKLTGKAKAESSEVNGETEIADGVVNGDDISFVETITYQGMPIPIVYKGKIAGDEIKFTRTILDMFTEELVAKRVK